MTAPWDEGHAAHVPGLEDEHEGRSAETILPFVLGHHDDVVVDVEVALFHSDADPERVPDRVGSTSSTVAA